MTRLSIVIALLVISFGLSLAFAATTKLGGHARNNYQQNRQLPPPLPPKNAGHPSHDPEPRASPTPCPGVIDCTAWNNSEPKEIPVEFPGPDHMTLGGHLYVPGVNSRADLDALSNPPSPGRRIGEAGPVKPKTPQELHPLKLLYPVVIYNHGSEENPTGVPALAKLYVDKGFAFFAPDRHGQGLSKAAGRYIGDLAPGQSDQAKVDLHVLYNRDVIAAITWLKKQPWVNTQRLIMTGLSYGGIQTLLTAEKDPGISLYLPFTPAAESWGNPVLRTLLQDAVRNEKAPMFLIQAEGDYNLGPIETLGPLLDAKGDHTKWKSKLYGKFGCTNADAHGGFARSCGGIAIWSPEVLKFIDKNLN
jgi:dienelactone hydrolase